MPEELRFTASRLLDAETPDPVAFLELLHQVRLRILFTLEQVHDEDPSGLEDSSREYRRLIKKQDAFQAASARMFMPVVAGWRRELFARAMLAERDPQAPATGPDAAMSVQQVLDEYYTLSEDVSAVYFPQEREDLALLRQSTETSSIYLRRTATSLVDLKRALKFAENARPGLKEVTRMFISSGLAFADAYEREAERVRRGLSA
ncbi:hypothetical protein RQP46_005953 [Phenoliferia psychrophenolica]